MSLAYDDVFVAEFDSLHAYFARRLGTSLADELASETFAIAYRQWSDLDPSRPVRPWLYGIAANLLKRHWRSEGRMLRAYARSGHDPVLADDERSLDRIEAQSAGVAIAAALATLRPRDREILFLNAWAGLSDAEIADAMQLPLGTVKARLSRTKARMRNRLGAIGQVEE